MAENTVWCEVEKCIHNMNNMCNAQQIDVSGKKVQDVSQTNCETFEFRTLRSSITNITNVNITGAVDQIFTEDHVMNPRIKCSVEECVYNSNPICNANSVTIGDHDAANSELTKCKTFKKK